MPETVRDTIDARASAAELFEEATDFERYPQWQPNIKKVDIKETDDQGRAKLVTYDVDVVVRKVRYTLAYDYSGAPETFSWQLVDGDLKALAGSYSFDEFEDVTEVAYELTLDPGFKVPGMLRRQAARAIVATALEGLRKRVESGA